VSTPVTISSNSGNPNSTPANLVREKPLKAIPTPQPFIKPIKRTFESFSSHHEPGERDDIKAILRKYADTKYEEIPKHFKEKIESHYSIKHQSAYYQKKTIRVDLKKYQSALPKIEENFPNLPDINLSNITEVWNPSILPEEIVTNYLKEAKETFMKSKKFENICQGHYKNPEIKIANSIEEVSLKVLHLCGYSVKKALYCLVAKSDIFWYDIAKQMAADAKQYSIHISSH